MAPPQNMTFPFSPPYDPFERMAFGEANCFLCGSDLTGKETLEHVFPKWLLNRFDLWDKRITLLNGTELPYRYMTIPCCDTCNGIHLAALEGELQRAFADGFEGFRSLEMVRIYQWMTKIFYGILFRELSLMADRQDSSAGTITTPEHLERFRLMHGFLQSVRVPMKFEGFSPWSIFLLETHKYDDGRDFDYADNPDSLVFAIRMNGIGAIACLLDNNAQQQLMEGYYAKLRGLRLHPVQFRELVAKVAYKARLMNRTPKYVIVMGEHARTTTAIVAMPLQGFSLEPIYNEWDNRVYVKFLAHYLAEFGYEASDLYQPSTNVFLTFLENEDGSLKVTNPEGLVVGRRF